MTSWTDRSGNVASVTPAPARPMAAMSRPVVARRAVVASDRRQVGDARRDVRGVDVGGEHRQGGELVEAVDAEVDPIAVGDGRSLTTHLVVKGAVQPADPTVARRTIED